MRSINRFLISHKRYILRDKKEQFHQEHRKELNQYHKAKRRLEPYLVEGSMDAARTVWEEKIEAIEVDISTMSNDTEFTALKEELEILKYIKDSMLGYCKLMTDRK